MMLSPLIGTSGPTYFINTVDRTNCGRKNPKGTFEERGIIVGLVGAPLRDAATCPDRVTT